MKVIPILWIVIEYFAGYSFTENYTASITQERIFFSENTTQMARQVIKKILSVEQAEGAGARVRRSVGRPEVRAYTGSS